MEKATFATSWKTKLAVLAVLSIALIGCEVLYVSDFANKGPWGWDVLPSDPPGHVGDAELTTEGANLVIRPLPDTFIGTTVLFAKSVVLSAPVGVLNVSFIVTELDAGADAVTLELITQDSACPIDPSCNVIVWGDAITAPGTYTRQVPLDKPGIVFPIRKVGFGLATSSDGEIVCKIKNVVFWTS